MNCGKKNNFCYVCGLFVTSGHRKNITKSLIECFERYFVIAYVPNVWYAPEIVCRYCYVNLTGMQNAQQIDRLKYKYVLPAIWLYRSEHNSETCYFCVSHENATGFHYIQRSEIEYAVVGSVMPSKERSTETPHAQSEVAPGDLETFNDGDIDMNEPSTSAQNPQKSSSDESTASTHGASKDSDFILTPSEQSGEAPEVVVGRHFITQSDFQDLVRDLDLSGNAQEVLASRLKQWKLVSEDFRVTDLRKRRQTKFFDEVFQTDDESKITYCIDVDNLFDLLGHRHNPEEWRLFIDGSVNSLKCVLLHNGNKYPTVPIAYATECRETYDVMKKLLEFIEYRKHSWKVCCDLKVVAILTGLKKGFSKHQCFLCLWEGRRTEDHYKKNHVWPNRITFKVGVNSIDHLPLIEPTNVLLPPLHIKLGIFRNFVRALNKDSEAFTELTNIFPKLSAAKIKAGKQHLALNYLKKVFHIYFFV